MAHEFVTRADLAACDGGVSDGVARGVANVEAVYLTSSGQRGLRYDASLFTDKIEADAVLNAMTFDRVSSSFVASAPYGADAFYLLLDAPTTPPVRPVDTPAWAAFGAFRRAGGDIDSVFAAFSAGRGVLPDGTEVLSGEVWRSVDHGQFVRVTGAGIYPEGPAIDGIGIDDGKEVSVLASTWHKSYARVPEHEAPRTRTEARRIEIGAVLREDARRFPPFAEARRAAVMTVCERWRDGGPPPRYVVDLLGALRAYEDERGTGPVATAAGSPITDAWRAFATRMDDSPFGAGFVWHAYEQARGGTSARLLRPRPNRGDETRTVTLVAPEDPASVLERIRHDGARAERGGASLNRNPYPYAAKPMHTAWDVGYLNSAMERPVHPGGDAIPQTVYNMGRAERRAYLRELYARTELVLRGDTADHADARKVAISAWLEWYATHCMMQPVATGEAAAVLQALSHYEQHRDREHVRTLLGGAGVAALDAYKRARGLR